MLPISKFNRKFGPRNGIQPVPMEYGRLVVLGYSSYRVAPARPAPRSETPSRTFGHLSAEASSSAATAPRSMNAASSGVVLFESEPAVARASPGSIHHSHINSHRKSASGQLWEPIGDQNAQYILQKRLRANGVALRSFHHFRSTSSSHSASQPSIKTVTTRIMYSLDVHRANERKRAAERADDRNVTGSGAYLMCVPMNDTDPHAMITEYQSDATTDMFQIGRMPCRQNDFVIPGPRVGASGTVSRFAARIVCSREPPYESRIYAGGFDAASKMCTAGHALKFCVMCSSWFKKLPMHHECVVSNFVRDDRQGNNQLEDQLTIDGMDHIELDITDPSELFMDGLTKNGVRVWLPEYKQWYEVSVNGNLYGIDPRAASPLASITSSNSSRSRSGHGSTRHTAFNRPTAACDGVAPILTDGAIIDLGGVQLQFQTSHRSASMGVTLDNLAPVTTTRDSMSSVVTKMQRLNIHCPVQLHLLRFTRPEPGEEVDSDQIPHVFPACGHVFGYEKRIASSKTCPLCRTPGNLVQLLLKENSQLQAEAERHLVPECVINPCGHAISLKLAKHYASLLMPNGRAICPFCAVHLDPRTPYSRLYLYTETDDDNNNNNSSSLLQS